MKRKINSDYENMYKVQGRWYTNIRDEMITKKEQTLNLVKKDNAMYICNYTYLLSYERQSLTNIKFTIYL